MAGAVKSTARKSAKPIGKKRASVRMAKSPAKRLRIREELLPESARYITIDDVEYVAMPVAEFGDWYEDALDGAVLDDREQDSEPAIPFERAMAEIRASRGRG